METKKLPLVITEDHHEVLPHIYRGIGSKRLPFSNLTMIHFDSHPDLLIPLEMMADDAFNKNILFETMSIENWIIPAVYAGHIDHVIWVKPPWCEQIKDKQIEFYVGKCSQTGCIRLSSTESYFLSEMLYVDEEKLLNKKLFHLSVVTLKPRIWESLPVFEKLDPATTSESENEGRATVPSGEQIEQTEEPVRKDTGTSPTGRVVETVLSHKCCARGDNPDSPQNRNSPNKTSAPSQHDLQGNAEIRNSSCADCSKNVEDVVPSKKQKFTTEEVLMSGCDSGDSGQPTGFKSGIKQSGDCKSEIKHFGKCDKPEIQGDNSELNPGQLSEKCCRHLQNFVDTVTGQVEGKQFILDIDLDFFSTLNPFRGMLTEFQYNTLRKLYRFTPPRSESEEAVAECIQRRTEQLDKLKLALVNRRPELVGMVGPDKELVADLLADLEKTGEDSGRAIDLGLIHEAGCTCDDSELPHHRSSDEQIQQLVVCLEHLISNLPLPKMITVARSSQDDYCPPDQVDFIEELLLETLHNVYDNLSVMKDYERTSEPQPGSSGGL